jgi:hypothetical protein
LAKTGATIRFNELMECDRDAVSRHGSKLGREGVVVEAERLGLPIVAVRPSGSR